MCPVWDMMTQNMKENMGFPMFSDRMTSWSPDVLLYSTHNLDFRAIWTELTCTACLNVQAAGCFQRLAWCHNLHLEAPHRQTSVQWWPWCWQSVWGPAADACVAAPTSNRFTSNQSLSTTWLWLCAQRKYWSPALIYSHDLCLTIMFPLHPRTICVYNLGLL